jgi:hypothetical protein
MSWSKIVAVSTVVLIVFGIAMIDCAVAGEKLKMHGTSVTTKSHQMKVGDEEGHIIILAESKQVYFNEKTGEKSTRVGQNIMDINIKTGKGSLKSYGVLTSPNGDKRFTISEGKPVGKGHWKGTYTYTGGTGKLEGIKGGGTWDSYSLASGISYIEVEGEMEISGQ